ncbi:MAG: hypothetical protein Q9M16_07330 [Mariprofundus sp.]|nr:hypothetical protein [Mariprofundus sp.]
MKHFIWNSDKDKLLIKERGISFERVIYHIERDGLLDIVRHPNALKYPNQKMFIVRIENYAYLIPFVESDTEIFLKTIIPSRKATKSYMEASNES